MAQSLEDTLMQSILENEGYSYVHKKANVGWVGLKRMAFTVGLFVGLDEYGYRYRYCYPNIADAITDALLWDGEGNPPSNWIKRKGEGGDIRNLNYRE